MLGRRYRIGTDGNLKDEESVGLAEAWGKANEELAQAVFTDIFRKLYFPCIDETQNSTPMSNKRRVYVYVTSHIEGEDLNLYAHDPIKGDFEDNTPASKILYGQTNQEIISMEGKHGAHGYASYSLPDDSLICFMFDCYENPDGSGSPNNCYFYTVIQNTNVPGQTMYYADTKVSICDLSGNDCEPMQLDPPYNDHMIQAWVDIYPAT